MSNGKPVADVTYDSEGKPIYTDIYAPYSSKDGYTSKMRIEGEGIEDNNGRVVAYIE